MPVFRYRLDEDAKSKLREIIEKRAEDKNEILVPWRKKHVRDGFSVGAREVALFQGMKRRKCGKDGFLVCFVAFLCYFFVPLRKKKHYIVLFEQIRQRVCRVSIVGRVCKWSR